MSHIFIKLLCIVSSFILLYLPLGCSSGFNYSALQLSSADLIDYGTLAKENDMPPGTLIYGALRSGVGSNAEQHSQGELGQVTQALNALQAISDKSNDVDTFVEDIKRELSQNINGKVRDAMTSVSGAEALAREMEGYVKKGSSLRSRLETLEKSMQRHGGATEFKQQSEKLIASFERLYQMGIVFAVAKSQGEASAQAGLLQGALERFKTKTLSQAIYTAPGPVEIAVINTLGKLSNLRSMITQMTTTKIVGSALADAVTEVGTSITNLKAACPVGAYSDAKLKPEMDDVIADAEKAKNELSTIATTFNGYERSIKESSDTSLEVLIKKGFSNEVGASLSSHKLSRETELVRFMRQLSQNKVVVLKKDRAAGEFIKALGVAVAKHNAEFYGLNVSNVYGFNAENLLKSKKLFSMADKDFQGYLESMAKKANAQKSDDDVLPIIFVLFIDDLGEDIDVAPIMRNLAMGKNRLVVVTENLHRFKNKSSFASNGLDVMSGFFVAKAVVEANDSKINASLIVEPLVKLYFGLSPIARPDLISLPEAAKDMLMRLRNNANPSADEIDNAAKETLASCKDKVSVELATSSQVLFSSLSAVADQLDTNKFHFLEKGKTGGGGADIEGNAEIRKTREDLKKLSKLKKILTEQNDREQRLQKLRSAHLAYKNKLEGAVPNISKLVNDYKNKISNAEKKAENTLDSMELLLENKLCVFKNRGENASIKNPGFDGGHSDFIERVGQQKFDPGLVKNPMQFFDINKNGRVTPKKGLSAKAQAAIGLNCVLFGRNSENREVDSQYILKERVKRIRAEVKKVSKEALAFAGNMTPYDLKRFSQAHFDLRERLSEDTLADVPAANKNYWGLHLSKERAPRLNSAADKARVHYGHLCDCIHILETIPSRNRSDTFPAKCKTLPLPGHFIATHDAKPILGATIPSDNLVNPNRNTSFLKRAELGPNDYSVINVYGFSLAEANKGLGLDLAKKGGIPAIVPPWIDEFKHKDFLSFNRRIWSWFMGRLVEKYPTYTSPLLDNMLYKRQMIGSAEKDPFARDEVFISVIFDQTEQLVQDSNRALIGYYGMQIIEKYKQMSEDLYGLKPADVNTFLTQEPATDLSTFFLEVERVLGRQEKIDKINKGTQLEIYEWRNTLVSDQIWQGIIAGFTLVGPTAGTPDAILNQPESSDWATLLGHANTISELIDLIDEQILLVNP